MVSRQALARLPQPPDDGRGGCAAVRSVVEELAQPVRSVVEEVAQQPSRNHPPEAAGPKRVMTGRGTRGLLGPVTAPSRRLSRDNALAGASFVLGGSLFSMGAFLAQNGAELTHGERHLPGRRGLLQPRRLAVDRDHAAPSLGTTQRGGAVRRDAASSRSAWWRPSRGAHAAPVQRLDLAPGHHSAASASSSRGTSRCSTSAAAASVIRAGDVGWWIVVINQLGSVLFFLAGVAAFVRPATEEAINVGLVNWGTFAGASCFAVAGIIQLGGGLRDLQQCSDRSMTAHHSSLTPRPKRCSATDS